MSVIFSIKVPKLPIYPILQSLAIAKRKFAIVLHYSNLQLKVYIVFYGSGWIFLIILYEEEERERAGKINILMNR